MKIYTDGGNSLKNKVGGSSAIIVNNDKIIAKLSQSFEGPNITNNTMELWAVIMACQYVLANPELDQNITIISDSQYVVNGASKWINKWKLKNWKSTTGLVKNRELWEAIDYLKSVLNIKFEWVKGHNFNKYNELADKLAVKSYQSLIRARESSLPD